MKLLVELTEEVQYIKEEKEGKECLYIKGPFAEAEVGNRNKRWYPLPILEREITRYTKDHISRNCAFGELNHPAGPNINLDRAAILIKEMTRDGNKFVGKALVTSTPMGNIVKGLINDGAQLGVSTRALGSLKFNKSTQLNEVQDDLKLVAVDIVADPSAPSAWVEGIMEGASWIYDAAKGIWVEHVDTIRKEMKTMPAKEIEARKLQLFEQFLSGLNSR